MTRTCPFLTFPSPASTTLRTVLLKFVADKKKKLDSGTLYAAQFNNQRNENGLWTWDVAWVELSKGEGSHHHQQQQHQHRIRCSMP